MQQGTIKRLVRDRGFGFIRADEDGAEIFFHRSMVEGRQRFEQLAEGGPVNFEEAPANEKGRRCQRVESLAR